MRLEKLFKDHSYLQAELDLFLKNKQLKTIQKNDELVRAHLKKARHNLAFYKENNTKTTYNDWLIVTLYYALYHCALALITKKGYTSKNHYATLLILIKEYNISKEEATLMNELSISKEDAALYTNLKDDRHKASYATSLPFSSEQVASYERDVITFLQKTEALVSD